MIAGRSEHGVGQRFCIHVRDDDRRGGYWIHDTPIACIDDGDDERLE